MARKAALEPIRFRYAANKIHWGYQYDDGRHVAFCGKTFEDHQIEVVDRTPSCSGCVAKNKARTLRLARSRR